MAGKNFNEIFLVRLVTVAESRLLEAPIMIFRNDIYFVNQHETSDYLSEITTTYEFRRVTGRT